MIYPLVALFFGTGNETPHISSAILERVFLDPSMRLFEFSEVSFRSSFRQRNSQRLLFDLEDSFSRFVGFTPGFRSNNDGFPRTLQDLRKLERRSGIQRKRQSQDLYRDLISRKKQQEDERERWQHFDLISIC